MKKKSVLKLSLITIGIIILIPCLFIRGVLGYRWTQDYIFYPRTIQDVIDKYGDMDEEKAFERGYSKIKSQYDESLSITYRKPVYEKYEGRHIAKNRIYIKLKANVAEDYMNQLARKYKSEIVTYLQGENVFAIELKKNHTLEELEAVVKEISADYNVNKAIPD